jgi:NADPH:quinone reductase-like Zn-dependent oxidoreductase
MRAIVLEKLGGLDTWSKDIAKPEPKGRHVVIEIKAFGINYAEMHMRRGEWAEAVRVSGIECVGLVISCPGGESFRLVRNSESAMAPATTGVQGLQRGRR